VGIFSDSLLGTGVLTTTIGPGSNFFNFIKEEAFNALGIRQSLGIPGQSKKTFVRAGTITDPRTGEITTSPRTTIVQQPDLRVFIKKKEFAGFKENFTSELLSEREQLYSRILKRLVAIKIEQLAQYESLTKAVKRIQSGSALGNIFSNIITDLFNTSSDRALYEGLLFLTREEERSKHLTVSQWVVNPDDPDNQILGHGTGVIELTNVASVNTTLNLEVGDVGSLNVSLQDPFNFLLITPFEIESAVKQVFAEQSASLRNDAMSADLSFESINQSLQNFNNFNVDLGTAATSQLESGNQLNVIGKPLSYEFISTNEPGKIAGGSVLSSTQNFGSSSGDADFAGSLFADDLSLRFKRGSTVFSQDHPPDGMILSQEEAPLFNQIVSNFKSMKGSIANAKNTLNNRDQELINDLQNEFLRKYSGRTVFAPMDSIYIYASGNSGTNDESFLDDKASDESIRSRYRRLIAQKDSGLHLSENEYVKLVKEGMLLSERNGTFIFTGVIRQIERAYDEGQHTLRITGNNNLRWFEFSRINTQPGLRQPQGSLNNPITPYEPDPDNPNKLKLLKENEENLSDDVKQALLLAVEKSGSTSNSIIVPNFDGIAFRWKTGSYSTTSRIGFRESVDGEPRLTPNDASFRVGLNINSSPFSNLDAADIVSLLITGVPYNFNTFLKNSIRAGIYTTGQRIRETYAASIIAVTRAFNNANGQFEPFITIPVKPTELNENDSISSSLTDVEKAISERNRELDLILDRLTGIVTLNIRSQSLSGVDADNLVQSRQLEPGLQKRREDLERELSLLKAFKELRITERKLAYKDVLEEARLKGILGDVEGDLTDSDTFNIALTRLNGVLSSISQKLISDVRLNRDKNYFIISNEYEEDLDVQAFARFLRNEGPDLWQSHYESAIEICKNVATTLDFELFCDAFGNIHFRPPQYNKTPLSILRKLAKQDKQRPIFPTEIKSLIQTSSDNLDKSIKKIDDRLSKSDTSISTSEKTFLTNQRNRLQVEKHRLDTTFNAIKDLTLSSLISETSGILFDRFVEVDERASHSSTNDSSQQYKEEIINQRFDNLGVGSHKRFIIGDDVIINFSFSEAPPPYTRVDVSGQTDLIDINAAADPLYVWAGAVDYDLWREFGYNQKDVTKPFFRTDARQCQRYAEFLINRARKEIVTGTVTLIGNEYYQLGDVVFFEPYGLLFYVTGINHSFSFGQQFTTTLTLSYGRAPGEYIPTPLDIIGKNLLVASTGKNNVASEISDSNKLITGDNKTLARDLAFQLDRERILGIVRLNSSGELLSNQENYRSLLRILALSQGLVGKVTLSDKTKNPVLTKLIIRGFGNNGSESANKVKDWLLSPTDISISSKPKLKGEGLTNSSNLIKAEQFNESQHRRSSELLSLTRNDTNQESNLVEVRVVTLPVDENFIINLNAQLSATITSSSKAQ
jgi:hypothetical protein